MSFILSRRGLLVLAAFLPGAAFGQADAATAPVVALQSGLLAVMQAGRSASFEQRLQVLTPVVQQAFDLPVILQNSVGRRFAALPPAQQSDLLAVFTAFTASSYVANFDSFSGERFEIAPEIRKVGSDEKIGSDEIVQTRIIPTSGDPARLDYVVRANGGLYKIVDVLLNGSISRVAVQRSDFSSLVATGDAGPLIASLRTKIASLSAGSKE